MVAQGQVEPTPPKYLVWLLTNSDTWMRHDAPDLMTVLDIITQSGKIRDEIVVTGPPLEYSLQVKVNELYSGGGIQYPPGVRSVPADG